MVTEEQWERVLLYYCAKGGRHLPSLIAAKQFQGSMEQIQRSAGHSQGQFSEVSQALLDMAQ